MATSNGPWRCWRATSPEVATTRAWHKPSRKHCTTSWGPTVPFAIWEFLICGISGKLARRGGLWLSASAEGTTAPQSARFSVDGAVGATRQGLPTIISAKTRRRPGLPSRWLSSSSANLSSSSSIWTTSRVADGGPMLVRRRAMASMPSRTVSWGGAVAGGPSTCAGRQSMSRIDDDRS